MAEIKLDFVNSFTDARGKRRHVFRRKGHRRVTIKGRAGSPEFVDAYHALIEKTGGTPSSEIGQGKAKAGTVDAIMISYFKDDAFKKGLAKSTQDAWRPILDRFRAHHT